MYVWCPLFVFAAMAFSNGISAYVNPFTNNVGHPVYYGLPISSIPAKIISFKTNIHTGTLKLYFFVSNLNN